MATNPPSGDGHRQGAIRGRSQMLNPKIDRWVERDTSTGQFKNVKSNAVSAPPIGRAENLLL